MAAPSTSHSPRPWPNLPQFVWRVVPNEEGACHEQRGPRHWVEAATSRARQFLIGRARTPQACFFYRRGVQCDKSHNESIGRRKQELLCQRNIVACQKKKTRRGRGRRDLLSPKSRKIKKQSGRERREPLEERARKQSRSARQFSPRSRSRHLCQTSPCARRSGSAQSLRGKQPLPRTVIVAVPSTSHSPRRWPNLPQFVWRVVPNEEGACHEQRGPRHWVEAEGSKARQFLIGKAPTPQD